MNEELKPCPFCGSVEISSGSAWPGFNEECSGIVQCHGKRCWAYMLGTGEAEAIAAWNTREEGQGHE